MKAINLSDYGLKELSKKEQIQTTGGDFGLALAVTGAFIYLYNNWDDLVDGFKRGQEQAKQELGKA